MSELDPPQSVHLVGSIGLDTVDEVFRTVGALLIATECGMARARSEETVRALLQIHADVCSGG